MGFRFEENPFTKMSKYDHGVIIANPGTVWGSRCAGLSKHAEVFLGKDTVGMGPRYLRNSAAQTPTQV